MYASGKKRWACKHTSTFWVGKSKIHLKEIRTNGRKYAELFIWTTNRNRLDYIVQCAQERPHRQLIFSDQFSQMLYENCILYFINQWSSVRRRNHQSIWILRRKPSQGLTFKAFLVRHCGVAINIFTAAMCNHMYHLIRWIKYIESINSPFGRHSATTADSISSHIHILALFNAL